MATNNKDFKIKNGLVVQGTTATVNGEDILTTGSNLEDLANVDTAGVQDSQALIYDLATNTWIPGEAIGGGGGSYTISATPPENPGTGDVWFDSTDGKSYIYFEDYDSSSQWVEIGSRSPGPKGDTGDTGATGDPGRFYTSDTAPSNPVDGDVWFNTSNGVILVYYTDGDSSQWVESGYPVLGYQTLDGLTDTSISNPVDGDALVYDSATDTWINSTPASTLSDLTDTEIYEPTTGQALVYNSVTDKWANTTLSSNLNGISDVVIDIPADNEVLAYNNATSTWINQTAAEAGLASSSHTHTISNITDLPEQNYRNIFINSNFGIWQRGTSFTTSGYTADRWLASAENGDPVVTRSTTVPFSNDEYSLQIETTTAGSSYLAYRIEADDMRSLIGRSVRLDFYHIGGAGAEIYLDTFYASTKNDFTNKTAHISNSLIVSTSSPTKWNRNGATITIPTTAINGYEIRLRRAPASGQQNTSTKYARMQLVPGTVGPDNVILAGGGTFAAELALCQRYFEKSLAHNIAPNHNVGGVPFWPNAGSLGCGGNTYGAYNFKVSKRATPSMRFYDPAATHPANENWWRSFSGCSGGVAVQNSFALEGLSSEFFGGYWAYSTGAGFSFHWTADAEL